MKKMTFFAILLLAVVATTSCGAKKQVAQNGYYQPQPTYQQPQPQPQPQPTYQQPQQQPQQPAQQVRPTRQRRELDPCILKAQEESQNLRAYGTSVSYVEREAINNAKRDARNEIANSLAMAIEGAATSWAKTGQKDQRVASDLLDKSNYKQIIAEELANTPVIETSVYDLSDGTIQVYVCIEMRTSTREFAKKITQEISNDEFLRMEYEQQQFMNDMQADIDAYKANKRKELGL